MENKKCSWLESSDGTLIHEGDLLMCAMREGSFGVFVPGPVREVVGFTVDRVLLSQEHGWHVVCERDGGIVPLHQFCGVSEIVTGVEPGVYVEDEYPRFMTLEDEYSLLSSVTRWKPAAGGQLIYRN